MNKIIIDYYDQNSALRSAYLHSISARGILKLQHKTGGPFRLKKNWKLHPRSKVKLPEKTLKKRHTEAGPARPTRRARKEINSLQTALF